MKTVRRAFPDLLPDLLQSLPHATQPELDLLLSLLKAEVASRIAVTHTSTINPADVQWQPPKET